VLDQYLTDAIEAASMDEAVEAIILRLDTPGGSVDITKSITQKMLASPVPIVVYVWPAGAHAGSAGTFITLAGHVAAMAPGSSIGAASPVTAGGADVGETMEAKVENILSADIENLAERRGEDAIEWAIAAVREAEAATANRALELGVIDFIASDVSDLLEQMDGMEVTLRGESQTIESADAFLVTRELSRVQEFLNFLANPTIASLLLTLGTLGLIVEIRAPGIGLPGIAGAVCLLLAFYALGQLDASYTGLALIALALVLFVAELFTPTFGLLAIGGVVSFILGFLLLFETPGVRVPWAAVITLAVGLGGFSFFAGTMALAAQRRQAMTGGDGLIGQRGKVRSAITQDGQGDVFVYGEWWDAKSMEPIAAGDQVEVIGRDGYTLVVRKV
jgi:membrane-bound serine protease (ClpP class)